MEYKLRLNFIATIGMSFTAFDIHNHRFRCIQVHYLILKGLGTFQAWHYKGKCPEHLGKTDESLSCYLYAIEQSPSFALSHKELSGIPNKLEMAALIDSIFLDEDRNRKIKAIMDLQN